jgi:hypothetical protein
MKKIFYCLLALMVVFLTSCSETKLDLKDVLGAEIDLVNKDYEYGDYLSFSGEGYSGLLYSISDAEMDSLISSINTGALPQKRESFKVQLWSETPIIKQSEEVVTLVSSYFSKNKEFLKFQESLREVITENDNYFSYYYKETEGNIDDIELYVLDTENNKIYIVRNSV